MAYRNDTGRGSGFDNRPRGGYKKPYGDNAEGGYKKPYGERSEGGYKKPNGERSEGGYKKPYGESSEGGYKKPYGERSEGGYKKPYGERSEGGYKKPYGERSEGGYKKPYGERSEGGYKKPYGERSEGGYKKPYGERSEGGYKKPYGDKPYGERKPYRKPEEPAQDAPQTEPDELPYLLIGRNAVREAIRAGRSIDRILVSNEPDGSLREIVSLARDSKLVVRETDRKKLDELCMPFGHGGKTANHQGIVAYAAGVEYCSVQDILDAAKEKGEDPFVIVLDGIEDVHNLGSIIRSADCAGAHGVVIGKRRSASVTAAAVKASAGAVEYVKIARVVNIRAAVEELKKAGLWIAGADMHGAPMQKQKLSGPLALVIGSEGEGLSKLVRESCDFLVSIPMKGHIDSLNAGVAAAVLMFEKRRQDEA